MSDSEPLPDAFELYRRGLSRWDNEGGMTSHATLEPGVDIPDLTNAELVHLRVRVIALENLMIAVLANGSNRQRQVALDMAGIISPRPGFTQHPLTIQAARHITDLVHRADHFRTIAAAPEPYRSTPVFDETTLPAGLRREHRTKVGVWGVIRVLEGQLRYRVLDPVSETILDPDHPGLVLPDQPYFIEPLGPIRMRVDFYDRPPT